jgi:hypothetical protein
MKKVIACLGVTALLAFALGGCNEEQNRREAQQIQSRLPPGCEFKELGDYNGRPVVAVFCGSTTTTRSTYGCGKTTCTQNVITGFQE